MMIRPHLLKKQPYLITGRPSKIEKKEFFSKKSPFNEHLTVFEMKKDLLHMMTNRNFD